MFSCLASPCKRRQSPSALHTSNKVTRVHRICVHFPFSSSCADFFRGLVLRLVRLVLPFFAVCRYLGSIVVVSSLSSPWTLHLRTALLVLLSLIFFVLPLSELVTSCIGSLSRSTSSFSLPGRIGCMYVFISSTMISGVSFRGLLLVCRSLPSAGVRRENATTIDSIKHLLPYTG